MPVLDVKDMTVSFGGNLAVNGVDLSLEAGQLAGLIGPNGAGKTTAFNVITGLQKPSRGRVILDGSEITDDPPHVRARAGLARTFQRLELFGSLSAGDNVLVAAEAADGPGQGARRRADELLDLVGMSDLAGERADALPTGNARLVELARALATRPKVLLLDEPASGLGEAETARMADTLESIGGDGLAVLLVEHDVPLVMRICRHVTVLNYGEVLAAGTPAEVQADPAVVSAYLGHSPETAVMT